MEFCKNRFGAISEVGLLGELREVSQIEKRKSEAVKFGLSRFLGPEAQDLEKAVQIAFGRT